MSRYLKTRLYRIESIIYRGYFHVAFLYAVILSTYLSYFPHNTDTTTAFLLILASVCAVSGIYLFNKSQDIDEDILNNSYPIQKRYEKNIILASCGASLISILIFALILKETHFYYALTLIAVGFLYSHKRTRLKKFFLLKNLIPALSWLISFSILISEISNLKIEFVVSLIYSICILIYIVEILWDMPDIVGDKKNDVHTIPSLIGFKKTKILLISMSILGVVFTNHSPQNVLTFTSILVFLFFISENTQKIVYHRFVLTLSVALIFLLLSK